MYIDKTLGFKFYTFYERTSYELKNVAKFSSTTKKNIIKFSSCEDLKYKKFKSDWDIYVMWIDPRKVTSDDIQSIKQKFSYIFPLYAVFGENYVLITKIISKQIFQKAQKCTAIDIMDLFIFEMGGALCEKNIRPLKKHFRGNDNFEFNVIWNIPPLKELLHIEPKMHGWFSKNTELSILYILKNYKHKNIIEFGSWFGQSSSFILKNMNRSTTLYCFDKFQNIMKSPYSKTTVDKLDLFFLRTPRFETFCRNLAPFLTDNKVVYTVKYDINKAFQDIIIPLSIGFDIIFIDAIKKCSLLINLIETCLYINPKVIIIGDDYVFESVKKSILFAQSKFTDLNIFATHENYIITRLKLDIPDMRNFIKQNYFPSKDDPMYYYELIMYFLQRKKYDKIIDLLKNHEVDINKQIHSFNDNTLYTLFIIQQNSYRENIKKLIDFVHTYYKPKKVENVLGLDYSYYFHKNHSFY